MDEAINQDVNTEATNEESVKDTSVDQNNSKNDNESSIPYARFKEINDKFKTATEELSKIKSANDKAREQKLKEDGKLKELLDEKESLISELQGKAESWDKYKADRRDVLLSKLPESDRDDFADLNLKQLEKVVDKLSANTQSAPVANTPASRGGGLDVNMKDMDRNEQREKWADILAKHS
tara:strand:- start:1468 stop:2010 length:543 start_codon:yes stop_codon:yes gene_type:complete